MVFASLTFLYVFLPVNLLLYYLLRSQTHRNLLLILFSFVFYAWGEPIWISLLILSATVDYVHGLLIERYRGTWKARAVVGSSVVVNLSLLGLFKYSGFLVENVNAVFSTSFTVPSFSLPIGISFYTFQTISYVADVYRGELRAQRSYLKFLMFVSLYHQLVAGPIVRYVHIAGEIEDRRHTWEDVSSGITRFCTGLFKKVCVANVAGELVARTMDSDAALLSQGEAWFGLLMFTLQIYFDFSAYSDMAIGLGRMFGFHYQENFNYPYVSRTATEFWRRWHISLGSFFRDYVYIPLGGKLRHPLRNLLVVWFLTGLWHGASWNFILWGLYFGLLIIAERLFLRRVLDALPRAVGHAYLLFAVVVGWGLFYFVDMTRLTAYFRLMFGFTPAVATDQALWLVLREHALWILMAVVLCLPVYPALRRWLTERPHLSPVANHWVGAAVAGANACLLLLSTSMLVGRTYNPFLYFRF